MIKEDVLDNILVSQKDGILSLINNAHYEKAIHALETLQSLWIATNYEYKLKELIKRIDFELWRDSANLHWKTKKNLETIRTTLKEKFYKYL